MDSFKTTIYGLARKALMLQCQFFILFYSTKLGEKKYFKYNDTNLKFDHVHICLHFTSLRISLISSRHSVFISWVVMWCVLNAMNYITPLSRYSRSSIYFGKSDFLYCLASMSLVLQNEMWMVLERKSFRKWPVNVWGMSIEIIWNRW